MPHRLQTLLLVLFAVLGSAIPASAAEFKTRYATVRYEDEKLLRAFNNEVYWGGGFFFFGRRPKKLTIRDEVANKITGIIEKVEAVLEMFPKELRFTMVLLPRAGDVQQVYFKRYEKKVDYIAFYIPRQKTMYLSVNDIELRVLAHEIGHVVVDNYFEVPPPVKIHELLAQFAETHISD